MANDEPRFLIWSNQHCMWWGPARRGYTPIIEEAGRYSRAAAAEIVSDATLEGRLIRKRVDSRGRQYDSLDEVLVLAPESMHRS